LRCGTGITTLFRVLTAARRMRPSSESAHDVLWVVEPDVVLAGTVEGWLLPRFPGFRVQVVQPPLRQGLSTGIALVEGSNLEVVLGVTTGCKLPSQRRASVIAYSDAPTEVAVRQVLEMGLAGWLAKPLTRESLVSAVAAVAAGCVVFRGHCAGGLPALGVACRPGQSASPDDGRVSVRQGEIMRRIAQGYTEKQTADQLGLSARTVNHHIERLYRKWGVRNRAEALRIWLGAEGMGGMGQSPH